MYFFLSLQKKISTHKCSHRLSGYLSVLVQNWYSQYFMYLSKLHYTLNLLSLENQGIPKHHAVPRKGHFATCKPGSPAICHPQLFGLQYFAADLSEFVLLIQTLFYSILLFFTSVFWLSNFYCLLKLCSSHCVTQSNFSCHIHVLLHYSQHLGFFPTSHIIQEQVPVKICKCSFLMKTKTIASVGLQLCAPYLQVILLNT